MKRLIPIIAIVIVAGAAVTGCDRAKTTAYNNSGASATPGSTTTSTTTTTPATTTSTTPSSGTDTSNTSANGSASASTSSSNPAGANAVTDTVTTGKVKAAIASENGLKDSDLNVSTEGGVVKISGTVKSNDQIALATSVAQRQEGVQSVDASAVTVK
jgi:hypothetical protein